MENMDKETEQKIGQLQLMEQNLTNFITQKQNFQNQLFEIENALKELESCKDKTYKVIGTVMIASEKKELMKDLNEKKSMVELRIKSLEKQEKAIKDKATGMQKDIMSKLKTK